MLLFLFFDPEKAPIVAVKAALKSPLPNDVLSSLKKPEARKKLRKTSKRASRKRSIYPSDGIAKAMETAILKRRKSVFDVEDDNGSD